MLWGYFGGNYGLHAFRIIENKDEALRFQKDNSVIFPCLSDGQIAEKFSSSRIFV
jgi:hypothetical protein